MTTKNTTQVTNVIIRDLEFFWVKLDKPVEPFGTLQYEMQVQFPKSRVDEMSAFGKVKEVTDKDGKTTGKYSLNLKKKALKADGSDAAKVVVVDAFKNPMDSKTIGNGSVGNVLLMCKPYELKAPNGKVTKSGTTAMLTKVQVTKLVKFEAKGSDNFVDFDTEGDVTATTTNDTDF
jgi:hypothetical protein